MTKQTFETTLEVLSNRNVPYVLVDGAIDEVATVIQIMKALGVGESKEAVKEQIYVWDCVKGLEPSAISIDLKAAEGWLSQVGASPEKLDTTDQWNALTATARISQEMTDGKLNEQGYRSAFIFFTGDRMLSEKNDYFMSTVQLMMNMRDEFSDNCMALIFVGISFDVPAELKEHVKIIQAPLPSKERVGELVDAAYGSYNESFDARRNDPKYEMTEDDRSAFVESLGGVSEFQVNQALFLAMDNRGIQLELVRENAIMTINKTKGLSVAKGNGQGFSGLGGLDSIKDYMTSLREGRLDAKLILYVDEIN